MIKYGKSTVYLHDSHYDSLWFSVAMLTFTFTPGISRETSHGIFAGMYILVKKNLGQLIIAICLVYIHIYTPLFDIQYSLIETMAYRQIETLFWSWTHTMSCFRCN